jgi:hypothetical protein
MKKGPNPLQYLKITMKLAALFVRKTRNLTLIRWSKRFFSDYWWFWRTGGKATHLYPILSDFKQAAGIAKGDYFHQDLLVANKIFLANPKHHIDVGSRIDGFVAHVAAFRQIDVIDVRELSTSKHHQINFVQADLQDERSVAKLRSDSVSCLHALEHFGLGRYSDPVNPEGHIIGFCNLLRILEQQGLLYIGIPVGKKNEVWFNAHRVFHPKDILSWVPNHNRLELVSFDYVDSEGELHRNLSLDAEELYSQSGHGIYVFKKIT